MRNVIVICMDTVRKDFFDCYSRRIREASDIDVSECRAASAWSAPSHASMISGKLAHQHKVHTYSRSFDSLPKNNTLFSSLDSHTTLGVSSNVFASPAYGFNDYFDYFESIGSPNQRFISGIDPESYISGRSLSDIEFLRFLKDAIQSGHPISSLGNGVVGGLRRLSRTLPVSDLFDGGATVTLKTARNLVSQTTEPYFLFINLMDAHLHLIPHRGLQNHSVSPLWSTYGFNQWEYMQRREKFEKYWENRQALYGATIEYLDRVVIEFINDLQQQSDSPLSVVVTADHGENLGYERENGIVNHTSSLSEGLLHVPLSIIGDNNISTPDDQVVSHLDFPDLINSLANEVPFDWSETPRAEVIGMGPNPDPPSHQEFWDRTIRAVYDRRRKYIWDSLGGKSVYELNSGVACWQKLLEEPFDRPNEFVDLFEEDIERAREEALAEHEEQSISDATSDRLKQLGYL